MEETKVDQVDIQVQAQEPAPVPVPVPVQAVSPLAEEIELMKRIIQKWKSAINEIEELSILKQFADQLAKINNFIKSIPESMRSSDQTVEASKMITQSRAEVAKWTKVVQELRTVFESAVKLKWQGRIKYPIDWDEPDAWYALITLSMNNLGAETRLAWDRIVETTKKLDSIADDVSSILDTFLSFFGLKGSSSSATGRDEEETKKDLKKTGMDDITSALEKAIESFKGNQDDESVVAMPSLQLNAAGVSRQKTKRRRWIMVVFFFVLLSLIVIAYFSQKFGGYGEDGGNSESVSQFLNKTISTNGY